MVPLPLLAAAVVMAIFGMGVMGNWFNTKPQLLDRARMEQELKKTGAMKTDGTILVDKDFDGELNAIIREMNAIEKDAGAELEAIAKLP